MIGECAASCDLCDMTGAVMGPVHRDVLALTRRKSACPAIDLCGLDVAPVHILTCGGDNYNGWGL